MQANFCIGFQEFHHSRPQARTQSKFCDFAKPRVYCQTSEHWFCGRRNILWMSNRPFPRQVPHLHHYHHTSTNTGLCLALAARFKLTVEELERWGQPESQQLLSETVPFNGTLYFSGVLARTRTQKEITKRPNRLALLHNTKFVLGHQGQQTQNQKTVRTKRQQLF